MSNPWAPPPRKFDLAGQSVFLAMPSHRDLPGQTVISLLQTKTLLAERGIPIHIELALGGSLVHHARSRLVHGFLKSQHNRLFWVDSDITWEAKDFVRLLALSTVMDLVAGAYPAKVDPVKFLGRAVGTMEANEHGCLPVGGIGIGFCCMTRKAVQDVSDGAPRKRFHQVPEGPIPHPFCIPRDDIDDGLGAEGEDMAFFARAAALGYQLWVDPAITLGHIGPKVYSGQLLDQLQKVEAASVAA